MLTDGVFLVEIDLWLGGGDDLLFHWFIKQIGHMDTHNIIAEHPKYAHMTIFIFIMQIRYSTSFTFLLHWYPFPILSDLYPRPRYHLVHWARVCHFFMDFVQLFLCVIGFNIHIDKYFIKFISWSSFQKSRCFILALNPCEFDPSDMKFFTTADKLECVVLASNKG